jgi:uncharacterized protein YggE
MCGVPNFALDETADAEDGLMEAAIENAREKAERMAGHAGAEVGKVISGL